MKKLFTLLLLLSSLSAMASGFTIDIHINNQDLALVQYAYGPDNYDFEGQVLTFDANGDVELVYPDGSFSWCVYITPLQTSGKVYLKQYTLRDANGRVIEKRNVNKTTMYGLDFFDNANGGSLDIEVGYVDNYVLNVDIVGNPVFVSLMIGDKSVDGLVEGMQQISYSPSNDYIYITPEGVERYYSVTYNDVEYSLSTSVDEYGNMWSFYYIPDIESNGTLRIQVSKFDSLDGIDDVNCAKMIYDLNGVLVGNDASKLPAGVYVVKEGDMTSKVVKR